MDDSSVNSSSDSGGSPHKSGFQVFISYAAEDREPARELAEYLELRGWAVWWDRKIPVGRPFDKVIEDALRQAQCVPVLWSQAAVASR